MPDADLPEGFTSRPYGPADAETAAALQSLVHTISPSTLDTQLRLPGLALSQVVEHDGRPVALLTARDWAGELAGCRLIVLPEMRGQGLGTSLLRRVVDFLLQASPGWTLRTAVSDDDEVSLAWGLRRGFVEVARSITLTRDLPESTEELGALAEEAAAKAGVTLTPWIHSPGDRDWATLTALLARADEGGADSGSGHVDESATRFLVPHPGGVLLAERDGTAVGLTSIAPQGDGVWYTWFTGVVPGERGRGVGRALKLGALAQARSNDAKAIETDNDAVNVPVLRLNELFGFQRRAGLRMLHAQIPVLDRSGAA